MRYLIIGLGIYGTNLAKDLTDMGHEVIGADHKETAVDAIKDYIATAYIIDSTDEQAIGALPLKNVDLDCGHRRELRGKHKDRGTPP